MVFLLSVMVNGRSCSPGLDDKESAPQPGLHPRRLGEKNFRGAPKFRVTVGRQSGHAPAQKAGPRRRRSQLIRGKGVMRSAPTSSKVNLGLRGNSEVRPSRSQGQQNEVSIGWRRCQRKKAWSTTPRLSKPDIGPQSSPSRRAACDDEICAPGRLPFCASPVTSASPRLRELPFCAVSALWGRSCRQCVGKNPGRCR